MSELAIWAAVFTLGAYLVCGIPFGLIIAMAMGHVDVRTVGSGNIGTTNVARSVGKGAAGLTLLLDAAKVAVVPGKAFGADDCVRLSYSLSMKDMLEGLERIDAFVQSLQ